MTSAEATGPRTQDAAGENPNGGGPRPLLRPRLYEQLADHIADFIDAQGLSPGDRLPPERRLAKDLGVSRATLSRALVALEVRGQLEVRHGDGAVVRDPQARVTLPSVDDSSLHELLLARAATMSQLAVQAASHPDTALRAALLSDDGSHRELDEAWNCVLRLTDDNSLLARLDAALAERVRQLVGEGAYAIDLHPLTEAVRRGQVDEVPAAVRAVLGV